MNCLAEERFIEILDRGGLDATRPDERVHLESCEVCRESWASVAAAADLLAESRPKTARGRLIPLLVAAAMLFTIVGVIVWKTAPGVEQPKDPVVVLLQGTPEEVRSAREALLNQGRKVIPGLVAARPKFKGSSRLQSLQDLIFDLKRAAVQQDPDAVAAFAKLDAMRVDLAFENTNPEQIAIFLRAFAGLSIIVDPTLPPGMINEFNLQNATLRSVLEVLCAVADLDFDFRYGVIYLTTPVKLWSTDPAVALPAGNQWETQILAGSDAVVADKIRAVRITIDMHNAPVSGILGYLGEITGCRFQADPTISEELVTIKLSDVRLKSLIQLFTLHRGWDARIEGGELRVVPRKK
jgi:hypothetical protein